jgi:hypothetical protein
MRYPYIIFIFISVFLSSCSKDGNKDVIGSTVMICSDKKNQEICDLAHDGALCSIQRSGSITSLVIQSRNKTVKNGYAALTELDSYKACLENSILAKSVRRKSDEVSRFFAIANIGDYQNKIVNETKGIKPEINLWLYKKTGNDDYWKSMVNGVSMTENIHPDVYFAILSKASARSMDEAKEIADLQLSRTEYLNELNPEIFEFYIRYYLKSEDNFRAAVWYGLFAEYVNMNPGINTQYFKRHEDMKNSRLDDAQELVDSIIFDTNWMGVKVKDFEKLL